MMSISGNNNKSNDDDTTKGPLSNVWSVYFLILKIKYTNPFLLVLKMNNYNGHNRKDYC